MNKKYLAAGAGIAVLAISASFCLTMGDSTKKLFAEDGAHKHTDSCKIHHYEQVDPTSTHYGVKEYWICCSDSVYMLTKPSVSDSAITTMTHTADFELENGTADERYIAPYTFPDVFKTQMAYSTAVTIGDDGKVTSPTGTITIKAGVLKDAYESGYTHMKFHSNADSSDVTNISATQNSATDGAAWKNYNKRYDNDQDNRFWLKSFSEKNENLKIDSMKTGDHADCNLTLSDFSLFKSSETESWVGGSTATTYVAIEDGDLVVDNCGLGHWSTAVTIPESLMGTGWASVSHSNSNYPVYRPFYVKKLAKGHCLKWNSDGTATDQVDDASGQINVKADSVSGGWSGYKFAKSDGTEQKSSDGFVNLNLNGSESVFGLRPGAYNASGDFTLVFDNPSAYAIRLDYDVDNKWIENASYDITPLPFSSEGKRRVALTNYTITGTSQANISFPNSVLHKGIDLKIISTLEPKSDFLYCDWKISKGWNSIGSNFINADGVYTYTGSITFEEEEVGLGVVARFNVTSASDGTLTFEYSWID